MMCVAKMLRNIRRVARDEVARARYYAQRREGGKQHSDNIAVAYQKYTYARYGHR